MKTQHWLITGGCGFIGSNLVARILKDNPDNTIKILDNLSVGKVDDILKTCELDSLPSQIEIIVGDIRDYAVCFKACEDADVIVHLAANTGVAPSVENPKADMEANVIGTFNMLEAARQKGVRRFVFASSGAPVGECNPPIQ
jgi:UDP-glucose 4-epimerase